ncbi:MAG: type II toxin-antitoxin system RelB/DinJ family antitoxin [Bryobacterales bacterium]|nr:type II toxin-antitoxin system RelB/DinJ family antitoxin [Bryobacterales bacterium]
MQTQTATLHVRMDAEIKRKATEALSAMGLTASEAVRVLFRRIAIEQAFPLELKVPNAETRSAMAEIDEMVKRRNPRFAGADEMLAEIEETSDR